jgi:hypothetical protein
MTLFARCSLSSLRIQAREQILQRVRRKAQRHFPFRRIRSQQPEVDDIVQNPACRPFRKAGDSCDLTALEFSSDQCLLQKACGLGLQSRASLYVGAQTLQQTIEIEEAAHPVDFALHSHVRRGFELEVAPLFVFIQLSSECALDVPRSSVVTLDQVALVRIHDAHEVGEIAGGAGM